MDAGTRGPAVMMAGGAYNRNSGIQAAGLAPAIPLFEQAAREVPLGSPDSPIVIADYGASQGRNSLAPLRAAIGVFRARAGPSRPICVFHIDQSQNDFCSLFDVLASDPETYAQGDPQVFSYAVGRSYFEPLFPAASVTLGWCSWSAHWLSRAAAGFPNSVTPQRTSDMAARLAYERQAAADWGLFIASRQLELKPGGKLVVLLLSKIDPSADDWTPLFKALDSELTAMVEDGFITYDESLDVLLPTYLRSRAELLAPFAGFGSEDALTVEHIELFPARDPIWEAYQADGDSVALATRWAAFTRSALSPSLAAGLGEARSPAHVAAFHERLERRVAAALAAAPERMPITLAKLLFRKGAAP